MAEQRAQPRIQINQDFASIDEFVAEYVSNISEGGVFIRSRTPLPIGTRVDLKFSVILDDFETIEGDGEVVRVIADGPESGMGVAFRDLTPRSREVIQRLFSKP